MNRGITIPLVINIIHTIVSILLTYDLYSTDNVLCHFSSAISAGLVATIVASPVDVVKTRLAYPTGFIL